MVAKRQRNKLKKLLSFEGKFFNRYKNIALRAGVFGAILALSLQLLPDSHLTPKKAAEYARTSVKILAKSKRSGGSGVILESSKRGSIILTNRHVCGLITEGGLVQHEDTQYLIAEYKLSNTHDLCLVKIKQNLRVSTEISELPPIKYSEAHISGHPALFPHVATHGNFSGRMIINVMIGKRECTTEEFDDNEKGFLCLILGGIPIIKTFDSQLVTGTILPGSSGSAVFDKNGKISGLVFASSSRELSYAFIVPQEYIRSFVYQEAPRMKWQQAAPKSAAKSVSKKARNHLKYRRSRVFKTPL